MRFAPLFLSACFFALAGCQKPAKPEGETAIPGQKLKIVYIPKQTANPYFDDLSRGMEEAAKQLGHEYAMIGPATGEATSQIPIIKEQIQRGVDIIAISANSPDALNRTLDDAAKRGILVITIDSDLTGNESYRAACVLQTDFSKVGASQVELLGSQIGYEGEIAILSATRDAPNQNTWIAGMKEALNDPKYAKMRLVDIVYGDDQSEKSATETEALLAKHPDLRGIISPTSVGLAAAAKSIENAGVYPGGPNAKGPGLVLTGLSTPKQMRGYVEKSVVQSFQLWSPYDMGVLACHMADQIKKGKLKPAEGVVFEVPGLGKRAFGKNNIVILGPLLTFDKSNIANYDF